MLKKIIFSLLVADALFAKSFTGIILPIHDIQLSLSLDGLVYEILKKEGDYIKEGEEILRLDSKLQALETQRRKLIWQDESKLENFRQQEKILEKRYKDALDLYNKTKSISYDEITSMNLKLGEIRSELKYNQEAKKREKIEYNISEEILKNNTLKSPISGVLSKSKMDVGEWVKAGEPIVNIIDSKICYIEFNIDKKYISKVKEKSSINVVINGENGDFNKAGKVLFISPIADKSSGLILIKVEIDNANGEVTPGLSAAINFEDIASNTSMENSSAKEIAKTLHSIN